MRHFLKYWLPVLLWMAVMFTASADPNSHERSRHIFRPILLWLFPHMSDQEFESIHLVLRKCCHLMEYAILALLVFRALHHSRTSLPTWSWPRVGVTLLIVFLYACSDEYHQSFVPGRTALFSDVCIDTAGGTIGLFILFICHFSKKPKPQTQG
jgi:VanZ family protein